MGDKPSLRAPFQHRRVASADAKLNGLFSSVVGVTTPLHHSRLAANKATPSSVSGHGSDVDSDVESNANSAELRGNLSKWTNYMHGWQTRFIVLKNGQLSYYKSEEDSDFGCRGAMSLFKATVKSHEFDECRFDVAVNNCVWYLRCESPEDKRNWVEVLQSYNASAVFSSFNGLNEASLGRHDSSVSLQSNTLSTASNGSFKRATRSLREKVFEIETFNDILTGQMDTLQKYFDALATKDGQDPRLPDLDNGLRSTDFKGESITFRATSAGLLSTLQQCLEIINERDESCTKKIDKEVERRHQSEELYKKYKVALDKSQKKTTYTGPDLEEGPHSTLPEDEFFDAVESGLDKIEEDQKLRVRLRLQSQQSHISAASQNHSTATSDHEEHQNADVVFGTGALARQHRLWPQIDDICRQQLFFARQGVGEGEHDWQLFADEGEMKMYRREQEIDGMVVDPLKACHVVQGVTAKEMCHHFFMPEYRKDWETTLEEMTILETVAPDVIVFLQTHKRIWPATQRDALFWSHMHNAHSGADEGAHDAWAVCNHSIEHESYPEPNTGKCIRLFLTVIMLCQTFVRKVPEGQAISRDDLTCKITYCSVVNPGGWAPKSALRAVYKREYPKFLKRFTQYVDDQCKNKPIMF